MAETSATPATTSAKAGYVTLLYWLCQLAGWGSVGAVTIVSFQSENVTRAWIRGLVEAGAGIAITDAFRRWCRPREWLSRGPLGLMARLVAALAVMAALEIAVLLALEILAFHSPAPPSVALALVAFEIKWIAIMAPWMLLYFVGGVFEQRRQAALDRALLGEALRAAELRGLKAQVNPHFLFNALNSVRALIADDPAGAQQAVTQLARLLRYSLAVQDEEVSLARELETIDDYLALESLRLGERLRVEQHITPAARRARVPVMLLQTLVENAIKHGIAELPEGGRVLLRAELAGDELRLEVQNPRPATRARSGDGGVGLANASLRLRLMFGDSAKLELDLSQAGAATARVRLRVRP
jgi:hypothetical protein